MSYLFRFLGGFTLALTILVTVGCESREPIKVGFLGGMSGRTAKLGTEGRDGVLLAVEQINDNGGIDGREIVLLPHDDKQSITVAREGVARLIQQGVTAIIGNMTSSMTVAVQDIINKNDVVLLSPTTSTNTLSDIDDLFFRVYPESAQAARHLATYLAERQHIMRVSAIFDTDNRAHTSSWLTHFTKEFEARGGAIISTHAFASSGDNDFLAIARSVAERDAGAVFILANALDTALFAQQFSKLGHHPLITATEWSSTHDLIVHGGDTVEGIVFFDTHDQTSTDERYRQFVDAFTERFGYKPHFAAMHSYDCMQILARVFDVTTDPKRIKKALLDIRTFEGVQGPIRFNEFGDVVRDHYLMTIHNGEFISIGQW